MLKKRYNCTTHWYCTEPHTDYCISFTVLPLLYRNVYCNQGYSTVLQYIDAKANLFWQVQTSASGGNQSIFFFPALKVKHTTMTTTTAAADIFAPWINTLQELDPKVNYNYNGEDDNCQRRIAHRIDAHQHSI